MRKGANRLAGEVSPYLLQHAHNPVDWMPWGDEVWDRAKKEGKPVFLSIGYSTCHWCHVMERESFESEGVAEVLNRDFICVKVDREERPDVDRVYMTAVQAMSGQGGWPLSIWVTPEGKPFYGGTYFPPSSAHGRPGFLDALQQISSAWKERSEEVLGWAEELAGRVRALGQGTGGSGVADAEKILKAGTDEMAMEYDRKHGGFGGAPKFPRPSREEGEQLEKLRAKLEIRRGARVRPGKDDKVLASWNALAISGYAKAARWGMGVEFGRRAEEIWAFLEKNLLRGDGTPRHRWRDGKQDDAHLLEDYAGVLQALLDLHQATLKVEYLVRAEKLAGHLLERFEDRQGGGCWSTADVSLIARMKDDYDGAEPSGNAVAALALVELGRLTDQVKWVEAGKRILDWLGERMRRLPQAVPHGLIALQRLSELPARLVLAGEGKEKFLEVVGRVYRPDLLITCADDSHPSEFIRGLAKKMREGTAYLCEGENCQVPVKTAAELKRLLSDL